jgi:transcription antitermination factor NusG
MDKAQHTYLPMMFDLRNLPRRETQAYQFLFHIEALSFLPMSDHPATLPDRYIGEWRRREDRRGLVRIPHKDFRKGEQVKIIYGPLQDQLAIYQGISSERVNILMQLLGTETRATIDLQVLDHL